MSKKRGKKRDTNKEKPIPVDSKEKVKPNEVKPKAKAASSDNKQKSIPSDVKKKEAVVQMEEQPKPSSDDVKVEPVLNKVEDKAAVIDAKDDVIPDENIPPSTADENVDESVAVKQITESVVAVTESSVAITKSVSNDSNNFDIKHPLNSKWTLWYYLPEKDGRDWELCQHQIHTVNTVEDFWSLIDHVKQPSELTNGVDYSFFKNGIRPMWEDPQNVEGGRMTVINTSKCRQAVIDEIWLDVLLFLVGENFENTEDVCGMVLNVRNYGFKLAVWTTHAHTNIIRSIGKNLKKNLCTPPNQQITFELHAETSKNAQTYGRASSRSFFTI